MDTKTPFVLSTIAALGAAITSVDLAVAELHRIVRDQGIQSGTIEPAQLPRLLTAQSLQPDYGASRSVLSTQPSSLLESATNVLTNLQRAPGAAPTHLTGGTAMADSAAALRRGSEISVRPWFPGRQSVGVTVELSW
jgi:hypothetical protein